MNEHRTDLMAEREHRELQDEIERFPVALMAAWIAPACPPELEARVVPYSSVVGSGISIRIPDGKVIALLPLINVTRHADEAELHGWGEHALAERLVRALNAGFRVAAIAAQQGED